MSDYGFSEKPPQTDFGPLFAQAKANHQRVHEAVGSIQEARTWFMENLRQGVYCPCCGRFGKIYRRKFNSKMALAMIELYKLDRKEPGRWIHIAKEIDYNLRGSDYGMLPYWHLVEASKEIKPDGNPETGHYRLTQQGREFVENRLQVPHHIWIYNDQIQEVDDPEAGTTSIRDALGDHFNYEELMAI